MNKLKLLLFVVSVFAICKNLNNKQLYSNNQTMVSQNYIKGSFGFDYEFLKKYCDPVLLSTADSGSMLIVSPDFQGRVFTSTASGMEGKSFGWINYDLLISGERLKQFNPVGGEERFWLGPEGGQYSIYFKKGEEFTFENWQVPEFIDSKPFKLQEKTGSSVLFTKEATVINYSNFKFKLGIERSIHLMSENEIEKQLDIKLTTDNVRLIGYQTTNTIKNTGQVEWRKESGLLSIWLLSMFTPSEQTTVVIPCKKEENSDSTIVNDDYFGPIPDERLKVKNQVVFFRADGKYRSKIGINSNHATRFAGSYDAQNKILTVLETTIPEGTTDYVNSAWKVQDNPYRGDVINAYNDGPLEDGSQMGPFYELESSSPARELAPGQQMAHTQRIYHFEGTENELDKLSYKILGVSLYEIKTIFSQSN